MQKNHESAGAWSALVSLSLAAALGLGCSGEFPSAEVTSESTPSTDASERAPSNDAAENALIESYLANRGFDTSDLQFEGDEVIVEGGMAVQRAVLLDAADAEASGVFEKGYFRGGAGGALFSGKSIKLSFVNGDGGKAVSPLWQTALNNAKNEWNAKVPRFSQPGPGSAETITVKMAVGDPPQGGTSPARGHNPPERLIEINPNYKSPPSPPADPCPLADGSTGVAEIETLTATAKFALAVHEMGHVLGFEHPRNRGPQAVHIPETLANAVPESGPGSNCDGTACVSYTTVMLGRGCFQNLTSLQSDDVTSAHKKYPSCRTVCETNCLSLIDPGPIGLCMADCPRQCGG
jgi:hypothetical protein